jgi:hypothetical protein
MDKRLKIPKWLSEAINQRTDNTMDKRKMTKIHTKICKSLHRKLNIEQQEQFLQLCLREEDNYVDVLILYFIMKLTKIPTNTKTFLWRKRPNIISVIIGFNSQKVHWKVYKLYSLHWSVCTKPGKWGCHGFVC